MTLLSILKTNLSAIGAILAVMAAAALLETAIPLHARGRWHRTHVGPNLALTFLTFATSFVFNGGLVLLLAWLAEHRFGLLRLLPLHPLAAGALAVVALDFSFYVAHVAMHKVPAFWRVHRVHHSDPVVDVTTTIRQHPLEGVIRYAFLAAFAGALGAGLGAFAIYRVWSAVNGLLEHANIRVPRRLDAALSLVTTWPNLHKIHHSRDVRETDSNYGNIFSWFDRLFGTYTPSWRGTAVACGLDGFDDPSVQTTSGLLAMPFSAPMKREGAALNPGEERGRENGPRKTRFAN
jgi:sterol desaturase/sphingolipid hydroxylase (fatty acid hydroxylase superfamily)